MANILDKRRQAGAMPTAAPPMPTAAPAAPARQDGSGYVGLEQLLAANRPGAQGMADKAVSLAQQRGEAANQALNTANDTFNRRSAGDALTYDASKAPTAAQAAELAKRGTYQGPKDWADAGIDVAGVNKSVQQGADAARGLGSAGGIAGLVRESYNGSGGSAGGSALDAGLAQAVGGQRFAQTAQLYGDLEARLAAGRKSATDLYSKNTQGARDAAAQYATLAEQLAAQEAAAKAAAGQVAANAGAAEVRAIQDGMNAQDGQWTQDEADRLEDMKGKPKGGRVVPVARNTGRRGAN